MIGGIACLGILFSLYVAIFWNALDQNEDHVRILMDLPRAIISSDPVRIGDEKYLAKNSSSFLSAMRRSDFVFIEQMGSAYIFEKEHERYIASSRMYSRYFMVFTHPKKI
jgi:hypothetical protein